MKTLITILPCLYFGINGYIAGYESSWAKNDIEKFIVATIFLFFGLLIKIGDKVIWLVCEAWECFGNTRLGFFIDFHLFKKYDNLSERTLKTLDHHSKSAKNKLVRKQLQKILHRNNYSFKEEDSCTEQSHK